MVLAHVDHITPRLRYIFEFIFRDVLGLDISLTESRDDYHAFSGAKFSYRKDETEEGTGFFPSGLLSEKGLHQHPVETIDFQDRIFFFPVKEGGSLPFDPFSMAFFILSRMEEYQPFEPDVHGRFIETHSLQFKTGILHDPVINNLAYMVLDILRQKYPDLGTKIKYAFLPTIDVDIAYAHLGKDPLRALGGYAKIMLKGDIDSFKERWRVVNGKLPDPYDNFDLHLELAEKYNTGLIYFLLLGDYGKYDKMISYKNMIFRELITKLSDKAETGIHPSYASFGNIERVKKEKDRLEEITGKPVEKHRAHFLRLKFPDTYRDLISLGIKEDYSLGYSGINGFRAGTANPFYFYDVLKDEKTDLLLHPFIFMDSAMIDNLKMSPERGEEESRVLLDKVKKYGGKAIGIWHNYSLCEKGQYAGWQGVFRNVMKKATE